MPSVLFLPSSKPIFYIPQSGTKFNLSVVERKIGEIIQTLRLAKKTTREDYTQHLRLVALGLAAVGGIAFVIKLVSEFITLGLTD
jgi:protein transport protein SEC61 subunit gamma and related proteins